MFPITPMDWTRVALRGSTQVMALQLRLARAMVGMALDQQRKAIGLASLPLPGAPVNICAPLRRHSGAGQPRPRPAPLAPGARW